MKTLGRWLLVSFLIWLLPFLASMPFFNREGQLIVNFWIFKTLMVAIMVATAIGGFRWFYRSTTYETGDWRAFSLLGAGTMGLNIALDSLTVIPLTNMSLVDYSSQVGVWYGLIVVVSLASGLRLQAAQGAPR